VQAIGVAAGTVIARAVIRDTTGPEESMRLIAYLAAGIGLAPTIAPMLGGIVVESWGWQGSFYLAAGAALAVWIWLVRGLPETLRQPVAIRDDVDAGTHRLLLVIRSPAFWGYTLTYGFSNAGFFCFLTNGPTFFADVLGIGPRPFGIFIGALSGAYVVGAYLSSALVRRAGMWRTLRFGVIAMIGSAIIVLGAALVAPPSVFTIGIPFMLLYASTGVVNPAALTGAVMCRQEVAGTASGLSSSMGMAIGALGASVASFFYTGSFLSVVAPVSGTVVVVAVAYLLVVYDRGHREAYHGG
ncbi:MAG: MFS transporter, partial [Gammaproteobacteria bacterium]|nr:MFS transporter [Gammaproteobacteria bacterium]